MNSRNVLCAPELPLSGCGVTAVLRMMRFENGIQTTTEGGLAVDMQQVGLWGQLAGCFEES